MIDPRVRDALKRAAELAAAWFDDQAPPTWIRGWAEAVEALSEILPMLELREALENCCFACGADADHAHSPTCTMNKIRKAIHHFCDVMLGKEAET